MKAALGGPHPLSEVALKINELIENLEANGVEDLNYLTVYFVPRVGGRTKRFYGEGGKEIVALRFDEVELQSFDPISENVVTEVEND